MMHILIFLSIFFSRFNNKTTSNVARLEKQTKSPIDEFCDKIAPYLILACTIILVCLIFIALVKYGANITGTEANGYYYHLTG